MKDLVFDYIRDEERRQSEGLELIPSENYVSPAVLQAMGSVLTNKYSEGYPGKRYYGGNQNVDKIEQLAIDRAKELFRADHANVQPHSGANANEAVYFAWCEPKDTILAMSLPAGGHLTHGAKVTRSAHIYNFINYGVTADGDINYDELEKLAKDNQPRIILVGYSAFMKIPDFARVAKIAAEIPNCLLMADMAHVAGLIAGGVHPNPLDYGFHVMTTTTHKTLRGPRGGLILSKGTVSNPLKRPEKTLENIPTLIDRAVFPGTQGGPLEHIIAAKAIAFGEALKPDFKDYATQIVKNAKALAAALQDRGFVLQGGGTENHLILVDVVKSYINIRERANISNSRTLSPNGGEVGKFARNDGPDAAGPRLEMSADSEPDGKTFEENLDKIGLTLNANALPHDQAAFRPSGVRLGTPAITTRGLKEPEMVQIANWMLQVLKNPDNLDSLKSEVKEFALKFPVPGITHKEV